MREPGETGGGACTGQVNWPGEGVAAEGGKWELPGGPVRTVELRDTLSRRRARARDLVSRPVDWTSDFSTVNYFTWSILERL